MQSNLFNEEQFSKCLTWVIQMQAYTANAYAHVKYLLPEVASLDLYFVISERLENKIVITLTWDQFQPSMQIRTIDFSIIMPLGQHLLQTHQHEIITKIKISLTDQLFLIPATELLSRRLFCLIRQSHHALFMSSC